MPRHGAVVPWCRGAVVPCRCVVVAVPVAVVPRHAVRYTAMFAGRYLRPTEARTTVHPGGGLKSIVGRVADRHQ